MGLEREAVVYNDDFLRLQTFQYFEPSVELDAGSDGAGLEEVICKFDEI